MMRQCWLSVELKDQPDLDFGRSALDFGDFLDNEVAAEAGSTRNPHR
jgi:hypothetical protein